MTQLPCTGFNLTQQEEMEEGDEEGSWRRRRGAPGSRWSLGGEYCEGRGERRPMLHHHLLLSWITDLEIKSSKKGGGGGREGGEEQDNHLEEPIEDVIGGAAAATTTARRTLRPPLPGEP
jgi:hypothetical protein